MFRLLLLLMVFLHFSTNFSYSFIVRYIPFKNAQSINIYELYHFVDNNSSFNSFMNNSNIQTGSLSHSGKNIPVEKTSLGSLSWVLLTLPHKVNHTYGEQLEIVIPIIRNTWNIWQTDTIFNNIEFTHKQQKIGSWFTYIDFWMNYNNIHSQEVLNTLTFSEQKTIFLNKLYILENQVSGNNNTYIIR